MKSLILLLIILSSSNANAQNAICEQLEKDVIDGLMSVATAVAKDDRNNAAVAALQEQEQSNAWLRINSTLLLAQNHNCTLSLGRLNYSQYMLDALNCNSAIRKGEASGQACNRENWGKADG